MNGRFTRFAFPLMRIVVGLLFSCHGAQKLFGVLGGQPEHHGMMLIAGIIEFGGGLLMAIGLFTRVAAFLASGEMAAAYFMVDANMGFWPILNKVELGVAYSFVFLFIAVHGAGAFSLDGMRGKRVVGS